MPTPPLAPRIPAPPEIRAATEATAPVTETIALVPADGGDVELTESGERVLSKRQVGRVLNRKFREAAPRIADKFYSAVEKGLGKGDPTSMTLAAQMLQLKNAGGPVFNINTQVNTAVNAGGGKTTARRSFESILSRIEQRRSSATDGGVIDVEPEGF